MKIGYAHVSTLEQNSYLQQYRPYHASKDVQSLETYIEQHNLTKLQLSSWTRNTIVSNKASRVTRDKLSIGISAVDVDEHYGNQLQLTGQHLLQWSETNNVRQYITIYRDGEYYVYDSADQCVRKMAVTYGADATMRYTKETISLGSIEITRTTQASLNGDTWSDPITTGEYHTFLLASHRHWLISPTLVMKTKRYSGKEKDATGLYYYGIQYVNPTLMHWLSPYPNIYLCFNGKNDELQKTIDDKMQALADTAISFRSVLGQMADMVRANENIQMLYDQVAAAEEGVAVIPQERREEVEAYARLIMQAMKIMIKKEALAGEVESLKKVSASQEARDKAEVDLIDALVDAMTRARITTNANKNDAAQQREPEECKSDERTFSNSEMTKVKKALKVFNKKLSSILKRWRMQAELQMEKDLQALQPQPGVNEAEVAPGMHVNYHSEDDPGYMSDESGDYVTSVTFSNQNNLMMTVRVAASVFAGQPESLQNKIRSKASQLAKSCGAQGIKYLTSNKYELKFLGTGGDVRIPGVLNKENNTIAFDNITNHGGIKKFVKDKKQ